MDWTRVNGSLNLNNEKGENSGDATSVLRRGRHVDALELWTRRAEHSVQTRDQHNRHTLMSWLEDPRVLVFAAFLRSQPEG